MGEIERIIELPEKRKPAHAKPALYAHVYEIMKEVAKGYGYNLLIHGSMNRDLDLLAVPWFPNFTFSPNRDKFIEALRASVGGTYNEGHGDELSPGRYSYVINLNRGGYIGEEYKVDPQYYIDISVMASFTEMVTDIHSAYDNLFLGNNLLAAETLKKHIVKP